MKTQLTCLAITIAAACAFAGDVTTFGGDNQRTGNEPGDSSTSFRYAKLYQVSLPASPFPHSNDEENSLVWYPAAVRGAPLYLDPWELRRGPRPYKTVGMTIVAASDGHVYAYDHYQMRPEIETCSLPECLWQNDFGPGRNLLPKWNSRASWESPWPTLTRPIGITSTPVIDKAGRRVFVVACRQEEFYGASYWIRSISLDTGTTLQEARLIDFDPAVHIRFDATGLNQRGALALVNGRIYVPFSDVYSYDAEYLPHPGGGWVASIDANDLSSQSYMSMTQTVHGGGIWANGGVSADQLGRIYVATGTGLKGARTSPGDPDGYWRLISAGRRPGDLGDFFMAVVQLQFSAGQLRTTGWYQPGTRGGTGRDIRTIQDQDLDLGSTSVLVLPTIGGRSLVIAGGKDGDMYLLDAAAGLGHYDHAVDRVTVFPPMDPRGHEAMGAPAYWRTADGRNVVFVTGRSYLAALEIKPPSRAGDHWIKPFYPSGFGSGVDFHEVRGDPGVVDPPAGGAWGASPVVAKSTVGDDYTTVWVAAPGGDLNSPNTGVVYAISAKTGRLVYNSSAVATDAPGPLPHFPPITSIGGYVLVGTYHGYICYGRGWPRFTQPPPGVIPNPPVLRNPPGTVVH